MVLCAAIGLLLIAVGASALPRPAAVVDAQAQVAVPARPDPPASSSPSSTPSVAPEQTPGATSEQTSRPAVRSEVTLVPDAGPGTYRTAKVSAPTSARSGRVYRYDVRVEKGIDVDPDAVARAVARTLDDPRSWRSTGKARFSLVPAGERADLHAYLVTPRTTDRLCAPLRTWGEVSCQAGNKVVLNAKRWVLGAPAFGPDVPRYREYLVNHEFGHALGHQHVRCPRRGRPAPVMLQQTKGLQGCTANPWPSVTRG